MRRLLRSWLWRVPLDQEVDEELAFHVEMRTRDLIEGGMDPQQARETALGRFGDVTSVKRTMVDLGRKRDREMRLALWLEEFRDDVIFALRQLRGAPAFAAVAIATLALGIGANSAIFALVDATLLRPLPYAEPERLVTIWETSAATPRGFASPPNMLDWKSRSRTFDNIAAFTPGVGSMVVAGRDGTAETVSRQWVTAGIFPFLSSFTCMTNSMYGLSGRPVMSNHLSASSARQAGANGRNPSRSFTAWFTTSFMSSRRASARMLRLPSARGPHSMRPWYQPMTLPAAIAVETSS